MRKIIISDIGIGQLICCNLGTRVLSHSIGCTSDKIKFLSLSTSEVKVQLSFYAVQNHPRSRLGGENGLWMAYLLLLGKEKSRCRVVGRQTCKILRGENRNNSPKQSPFIAAVINFARCSATVYVGILRKSHVRNIRKASLSSLCSFYLLYVHAGQWTIIIPGP